MRYVICLLVAVMLVGCDKKKTEPATPSAGDNRPAGAFSAPGQFAPKGAISIKQPAKLDPNEVLATVNDQKLTRKEADTEAEIRIVGRFGSQIPPEQLAFLKERMVAPIVDTFIEKTVLLTEADKRKITTTAEEQDQAMKEIQAGLPKGVSVEEVMKNSLIGEAKMKSELINGIRINKLIASAVTNEVTVTDAEVTDFIDKNKERLQLPEHVKARHIQVSVAKDADEKTKNEQKKKADELRKKIVDGADFADTARKDSDCPSKNAGGDLGTFAKGQMKTKEVEEAAFSQKVNDIGPVIESELGYHIVQVLEHNKAGLASRDKVSQGLKMEKQKTMVKTFIEGLKKNATITIAESVKAAKEQNDLMMRMPPPGAEGDEEDEP